jgi:4-alpha-glucanotransferase
VAKLVMIPMQDILSLDGSHRMNLPGTVKGNWEWRFSWSQLLPEHVEQLRHLSRFYGRDGR